MRSVPVDKILLQHDRRGFAPLKRLDVRHGKVEHGRMVESFRPFRRSVISVGRAVWSDVVRLCTISAADTPCPTVITHLHSRSK